MGLPTAGVLSPLSLMGDRPQGSPASHVEGFLWAPRLPSGCLGTGAGMGWLLHLNEEAEAALSFGGRGWVGDCKRPKERPFRPHEKGSLQTPTL